MKHKPFIPAIVLLVLALLLSVPASSLASHLAGGRGRVVLIIIDKVTWPELAGASAPNLRKLAKRGGIGLLSNRTAKPETTSVRSYLTIGAGARADAVGSTGYPLSRRRFKTLAAENKRTGYNARIGLLATALPPGKTAVLGNADAIDGRRGAFIFGREVETIGVRESGLRAPGDTSDRMVRERRITAGAGKLEISSDYDRLLAGFEQRRSSDLIIIETGDTRRADIAGLSLSRVEARRLKNRAIHNADRFIGSVSSRLDLSRDMLIVAAPSPPLTRDGAPGMALTPIIMAGPDISPGLLTSPSTRRAALVTSTDIAPTIAGFFGSTLGQKTTGRPIHSVPGGASFGQMARQADEYLLSERLSLPIIFAYGKAQAALLALVVLGLVFAKARMGRLKQPVRFLILAVLAWPPAVFMAPLAPFAFAGAGRYVAVILLLDVLIAGAAWLFHERILSPLLFISGTTTFFIIVNLLAGAPQDAKSAFGYGAITAGRFYGLGNESLSVLVPAALVFSMLLLEKSGRDPRADRPVVAAFFAFLVLIIGFGGLGANTGGIIMASAALTWAYLGLAGKTPLWRRVSTAIVTTVGAVVALALADGLLAREPTHLGIAARLVYRGPLAALALVVKRKLMLNIAVFNYSAWSYVVLAVLVTLVVWRASRERQGPAWAAQRHPLAGLALISGLIGGAVGSVANDSGISVMAIVLGYLIMVMLYLEVVETTSASPFKGKESTIH